MQYGVCVFLTLPEQFTAVWVFLIVDSELQDATEVKRQPAQSEDQYQTEYCLSHLTPLKTHINTDTDWATGKFLFHTSWVSSNILLLI